MKWKVGAMSSVVVSDEACCAYHRDEPKTGHSDADYYGGFLVAESIPPELAPKIATLPDLLAAAHDCLHENGGPISAEDTDDGQEYVMVRRVDFDALDAAWRKATGAEPPAKRDEPPTLERGEAPGVIVETAAQPFGPRNPNLPDWHCGSAGCQGNAIAPCPASPGFKRKLGMG